MELNKIICGDADAVLKTFDDKVFDCCVTSPPYWMLRDYEIDGQIGLEETPEQYIEKLVGVFGQVRRVLKDDGTLWLNIADTYMGGGWRSSKFPAGSKQATNKGAVRCEFLPRQKSHPIIKPKALCLIPQRLILALQEDGWYVRSDIIWHKTNPMPESCTDRPTRSYEHLFLLSKSAEYYYNQIFDPYVTGSDMVYRKTLRCGRKYGTKRPYADNQPLSYSSSPEINPDGKNIRDVWTINNNGGNSDHIAVFPRALVAPCICAGCRPGGVVLDPFFGSGTVGWVALESGKNFVGIDISQAYVTAAQTGVSQKEFEKGQEPLFLD